MRFLMLNWRDPRNPRAGGAERVSWAYLSALQGRGHEVFCFTFQFPGAKRTEEIEGVRVVRGGGPGGSIAKVMAWYRGQARFDLVIDQHHGIPWFAPWWCRTHCVAYIHEVLGPIWNSFYPRPIAWLGLRQERWTHWLYRNVPFWTVSDSTKKRLQKHGVRHVTVLPNGVDTVPPATLPPKNLECPLRLAVVSRLAPNKRIDQAIRVVEQLRVKGVPSVLTIVGTGELEPALRQLAVEKGLADQVVFAGKLSEEEKNRRLQDAHLLLHTSVREGWGLNVIEANAMGTPAAVYPVEGLVDSTVHDETGWITAEETPETLARDLIRLTQEPERYARYRIKAWERAKSFQWKVVLGPACEWLEARARGEG